MEFPCTLQALLKLIGAKNSESWGMTEIYDALANDPQSKVRRKIAASMHEVLSLDLDTHSGHVCSGFRGRGIHAYLKLY